MEESRDLDVINLEALLIQVGGDKEIIRSMLEVVPLSFDEGFRMLRQALESQDGQELQLAVHYLKGGAESIKAQRFLAICHNFKALYDNFDQLYAESLVKKLEEEYQKIVERIGTNTILEDI